MHWIYLSPHFDDVVLSCGGLLWEQSNAGTQVEIWTLCAGAAPQEDISSFARGLHNRWQTGVAAVELRQAEDRHACRLIGAGYRYYPIPDCIYRRSPDTGQPLYASEEALFGALHSSEAALAEDLSRQLGAAIPAAAQVVCPLAIGGHVDHQLTRLAAENLGRSLWYYADYPYAAQEPHWQARYIEAGWTAQRQRISEAGVDTWIQAVAAYSSQISTFWTDQDAMVAAIRVYARSQGGVQLWRAPENR